MIPPLARRCWPSPHLCLAATWLASSHHPEMGRLSVVIYNIHTERLISHIQYSHREVNFTHNYQLMFHPCLLDPSCFLFLFLCMQHPSVCLVFCTENKENVVGFETMVRLGRTPRLLLFATRLRMDLLPCTILWVSHNIGTRYTVGSITSRVGIILSWHYSTIITTPYYHSILGPYSHNMILRVS